MAVPVTLSDAAAQLRLRPDELSPERSDEITGWIADAAAWVEGYTGQILIARDVTEQFAGFCQLQLAAWPVKPGAAVAIAFEDPAGAAIALTGGRVSAVRRPAIVLPAAGTRWPPVGAGIVTIVVRAGYEPGDIVPRNIRRAMLVLISAYNADREGGDLFAKAETTARSLCSGLRRRRL